MPMPKGLPRYYGNLSSFSKTIWLSYTGVTNLLLIQWQVGLNRKVDSLPMLMPLSDITVQQSIGIRLFGNNGPSPDIASPYGWPFLGSFALRIAWGSFALTPCVCSAGRRRKIMSIYFLAATGHSLYGTWWNLGYS